MNLAQDLIQKFFLLFVKYLTQYVKNNLHYIKYFIHLNESIIKTIYYETSLFIS